MSRLSIAPRGCFRPAHLSPRSSVDKLKHTSIRLEFFVLLSMATEFIDYENSRTSLLPVSVESNCEGGGGGGRGQVGDGEENGGSKGCALEERTLKALTSLCNIIILVYTIELLTTLDETVKEGVISGISYITVRARGEMLKNNLFCWSATSFLSSSSSPCPWCCSCFWCCCCCSYTFVVIVLL